MKNVIAGTLKALVTGVLFFLLFRKVDFQEFLQTVQNARIGIILAAFLVLWVGHYMCIFRWQMLMRPLMVVPSNLRLFGIYCIGLFFNLTFPTVVGGDVVKMYYAGKPSRKYAQSFAATFLDRDAGMLAMMMIAACSTVMYPMEVPGVAVPLIVWASFAAFVAANVVIFTPSLHRMLTGLLNRLGMAHTAKRVDSISAAFQVMGRNSSVLAGSLAISILNQLLVMSVTWIMSEGLRLDVPLSRYFVIVPVVTLISMIPISLNGMGLREYAYVTLLRGIGVDRESAVALGLLSSVFIVLSAVPGGIVYVLFRSRADADAIAAMETELT
jgi:glycosyltransferase 2 family protein